MKIFVQFHSENFRKVANRQTNKPTVCISLHPGGGNDTEWKCVGTINKWVPICTLIRCWHERVAFTLKVSTMTKICFHICSHGTRDRRDTHARTQKWYPTTKFFTGLPAAQPTASKHWRQKKSKYYSNHTSSLSSRIKLGRWRKANSDNKLCVLINSSKTRSHQPARKARAYLHDRLQQNYDVHNISHDSALLSKTASLHFTTSVVEMDQTCSYSPRSDHQTDVPSCPIYTARPDATTQLNRELRTQVSDTSKSASSYRHYILS